MDLNYYEKIRQGGDIRKNVIALRDHLKEKIKAEDAALFNENKALISSLLSSEDAKTRGAAARVLGLAGNDGDYAVLSEAFEQEQTRFIRPEYLKGMQDLLKNSQAPEKSLEKAEKWLADLLSMDYASETRKHMLAEQLELENLLVMLDGRSKRNLTGTDYRGEIILITNHLHAQAVAAQLSLFPKTDGQAEAGSLLHGKDGRTGRLLRGGIQCKGIPLSEILRERSWSELMLPLGSAAATGGPDAAGRPADTDGEQMTDTQKAQLLAQELAEKPLTLLMEKLFSGQPPYRYRLELKENHVRKEKNGKSSSRKEEKQGRIPASDGRLIQELALEFDRLMKGTWLNAPSDYEAEIRLLEKKDGSFLVMLVPSVLTASRFSYRKDSIAASIAPANAALCMALAMPYLKEKADILDPFCGAGTMLIERAKALPAANLYGIDIFGEAVEKAKANTRRAGLPVHYINRDFFGFQHAYLFDEIVSNLPQVTKGKPEEEIRQLYHRFFEQAGKYLKERAVLVLYSTQPSFVRNEVRKDLRYVIRKQFLMNEKTGTTLFVIEYREMEE